MCTREGVFHIIVIIILHGAALVTVHWWQRNGRTLLSLRVAFYPVFIAIIVIIIITTIFFLLLLLFYYLLCEHSPRSPMSSLLFTRPYLLKLFAVIHLQRDATWGRVVVNVKEEKARLWKKKNENHTNK